MFLFLTSQTKPEITQINSGFLGRTERIIGRPFFIIAFFLKADFHPHLNIHKILKMVVSEYILLSVRIMTIRFSFPSFSSRVKIFTRFGSVEEKQIFLIGTHPYQNLLGSLLASA